jgi:hypothetical protein
VNTETVAIRVLKVHKDLKALREAQVLMETVVA